MMNLETLRSLLIVEERINLFNEIIKFLEDLDKLEFITYKKFDISEGIIPIIYIGNNFDANKVKNVKLFLGAQHNEYNGLFGILEYLKMIKNQKIQVSDFLIEDQVLILAPLMNPYGFLNPSKDNKSGYYLKNGSNLNRFWRRIFTPEYKHTKDDFLEYNIPEHAKIIKDILEEYWEKKDISIYVLDFHETSLLYRFPRELSINLNVYYKFNHWLKEGIIQNIIDLYGIKYFREPLFFKCNRSVDHNHISLTPKQLDTVFEKLHDYQVKNLGKLAFYFCHSKKSENYCNRLAKIVYGKLKDILWETNSPAYSHYFHDHGCFVKMSDATPRKKVYTMELESQKQFFNLFEEIENSKKNPNYFENKLKSINLSLELAVDSIKEMIKLF